jgi:hypothetical protein
MNALFQLKKQFPPAGFFSPRSLVVLLLCGTACLTVTGALPAFFRPEAQSKVSHPAAPAGLTFAERVVYQRIIEDVYWRHRIWPKERPDPKPSLDAVMSQAQLERKVTDYLQKSQELDDYWQRPITADQLQAEMDRMAQHTRQPEVLHELFEALGNDPFVIAECLARPLLAERLLTHAASEQVKQTSRTYEQVAATGDYSLPLVSDDGGCTDDTWTATSTRNAPSERIQHTAVWTGSEMIIWGGNYVPPPIDFNTGGRYNPSTDSWTATTTVNAPSGRSQHTAVWTGSEMIVWGGLDVFGQHFNTGGRYNPGTDSWYATSTTGAPTKGGPSMWTGTEMIVWGENAARYNPRTDSWRRISTTGAPPWGGTAVWAGTEMIVWNGNTGGRYNPVMDSWTATTTVNAPSGRLGHTAVWTGGKMIIWGGYFYRQRLNSGRTYDPGTDTWTATTTVNAPSGQTKPSCIQSAPTEVPSRVNYPTMATRQS